MRVLVIDDDRDNAATLCELLSLCACETRCAYSGADALTAALEFVPDTILCDLAMPAVDGFDVLQQLRTHPTLERTRWIAYTGFHDSATREACLRAGFARVVIKPARLDHLLGILAGTS